MLHDLEPRPLAIETSIVEKKILKSGAYRSENCTVPPGSRNSENPLTMISRSVCSCSGLFGIIGVIERSTEAGGGCHLQTRLWTWPVTWGYIAGKIPIMSRGT